MTDQPVAWAVEINGKLWKGISASMALAEADIAWLKAELAKDPPPRRATSYDYPAPRPSA